ncbi:hypothetical protein JCM10207_003065 [Rhodosporidiobolus poonsookiae]
MEGIAITDQQGRRILATHFPSELSANTAIDAAIHSTTPVTWVQHTGPANLALEDDDDNDDLVDPHSTTTRSRGTAVCIVTRGQLRYIAPLHQDIDPLVPLTFLSELHDVLANYISGPVTEASLKDHFDIVLALLHEMVASGRPQLSQASQLRDLVLPPSELLTKVALNAATAAGLNIPQQSAANALLASPLPWRRQGIKYSSNEIYLDLLETLSVVLTPSGTPLSASIAGQMTCRARLSGMPDLALRFTDPAVLDESAAFHACVRWSRWRKEKVVSFVPPDGSFPLLSFQHTPRASTPALALALLPLSLTSLVTLGPSGGSFHLTLTSRAPLSRPLSNLEIRIPLARGAAGVQATVQGGPQLRDEQGRSVGGGAGSWDVVGEVDGAGKERLSLVWRVPQLGAGDRPAVLSGQYSAPPTARKPPSFTLTFDSPLSGFSGLRVDSLKVLNEPYTVYKGVKTKGRGVVEVRTG